MGGRGGAAFLILLLLIAISPPAPRRPALRPAEDPRRAALGAERQFPVCVVPSNIVIFY